MFTLAFRGVISGSPFFLSGTLLPKTTLRDGMPQQSSLWQGGLAEAQFTRLLGGTMLRVHLLGAAVGEDPWTEQEPRADQGLFLVRHPNWESAGVNPTPPSLAFSRCPNLYLLVRVVGWRLSQPARMQCSSGRAPTYTRHSTGIAAMASLLPTAAKQPSGDHACEHTHCLTVV